MDFLNRAKKCSVNNNYKNEKNEKDNCNVHYDAWHIQL